MRIAADLRLALTLVFIGLGVVACDSGPPESAEAPQTVQQRDPVAEAVSAVFGEAAAPVMPVPFASVQIGDPVDPSDIRKRSRDWSQRHEGSLKPLIQDGYLTGWEISVPRGTREALTKRWGAPEEQFGGGRAEWVWLDPSSGIEVAIAMPPAVAKQRDPKVQQLRIAGVAPMRQIVPKDKPVVPDLFNGLEAGMTRAEAAAVRPDLARQNDSWELPGYPGLELRVHFGARNLQAWDVLFWTWHPGKYLVQRWGTPQVLGDRSNPQVVWRNSTDRVRAWIPPQDGRAVVLRFSRFVPAGEWLAEDGLLAFENGQSWLGMSLDAVRTANDDLVWAEDERTGRVVVRLPATELGTDVVLEVKHDSVQRIHELILRYAGVGYPELQKTVTRRLNDIYGTPNKEAGERATRWLYPPRAGRQVTLVDRMAALEVRIQPAE